MILILIFQFSFYLIFDELGLKNGKYFVLICSLFCYFYYLPHLACSEPAPSGINCAMPIIGITLGFWIGGIIATSVTHGLYQLFSKGKYN